MTEKTIRCCAWAVEVFPTLKLTEPGDEESPFKDDYVDVPIGLIRDYISAHAAYENAVKAIIPLLGARLRAESWEILPELDDRLSKAVDDEEEDGDT